jgi:hypothetical protein
VEAAFFLCSLWGLRWESGVILVHEWGETCVEEGIRRYSWKGGVGIISHLTHKVAV